MFGLDVSRSPVGHSLALHLLLLLEDLVGLHCQPLLHEELLPLELTLPCLLQPFPVCHEQLPALLGRDCESSAPGEKGLPLSRSWSGVMGGHRCLLNLQLQLRRRWSGCGYSSGHSRPVDKGTVIQLGPDGQTGAMQAENIRVSQPSQHWLDEVYEEEIQQVGTPHLTSLWSMLEKSMPLTSTIWSPVWARNRKGLVCVHVCDPYIHPQKGLLACQT